MKIQLQIQEQCLPLYFLKPSIGPDWNLCQADSGPWALCLAPDSEYFLGGFAEKKCMNLSKLEKHHWHINSVYSHVPNHMYIFISEKCVRQHLHFEFLARVLLSALYSSCYMLPFSPASYWLCWCQGCYGCEVCGFLSNWPTFEAFLQVELFLSMSSCCVWKLPIYPKNHKSRTPACRLR